MHRTAFMKANLMKTCVLLALCVGLAAPMYAHHLKKGESTYLPVTTSSPKARELYEKGMEDYENLYLERCNDDWRAAVKEDPSLAIAWACAEALHDTNRCRALFATHYHELAKLESRLAHVTNLSMRAKEWNGDLVFLHEAGPGPADRSYGVQVAKLAGVPPTVVARARQVLDRLENEAAAQYDLAELPLFAAVAQPAAPVYRGPGPLEAALAQLDLDGMSPREAMEALYRLKGLAGS